MSGHPDPQDDTMKFPLSWDMISVLKSTNRLGVFFLSICYIHWALFCPFETSLIILPLHGIFRYLHMLFYLKSPLLYETYSVGFKFSHSLHQSFPGAPLFRCVEGNHPYVSYLCRTKWCHCPSPVGAIFLTMQAKTASDLLGVSFSALLLIH